MKKPKARPKARRRPAFDALFLDRDGTLIAEREFLADPRGVRLAPGAAGALKRFTDAGTLLFVVTNQSGIARGKLSWEEVDAVNAEVRRRLSLRGVPISDVLVCPHFPGGTVPEYARRCRCRKPGTALHERAVRAFHLDPRRCAVVGDKWDDVAAGAKLGAAAVHLLTGHGREHRARVRGELPGALLAATLSEGLALLEALPDSAPRRHPSR